MLHRLRGDGDLIELFRALGRGRVVYAPEPGADGQLHLTRAECWDGARHTLGAYRPVEPLKALFFRAREDLGRLDGESAPEGVPARVVIGVKNCDLSALRFHDRVFGEAEPSDPSYTEARRQTLLVSCDCSDCLDACFCTVVGQQPHPEDGFDLNVSALSQGYVVETGSEQGEAALRAAIPEAEPAPAAVLEERDRRRAEMRERVAAQAARHGLRAGLDLQGAVQQSFERPLWEDFAADCVECGACNFICCTCHCFLLADGLLRGRLPGAREAVGFVPLRELRPGGRRRQSAGPALAAPAAIASTRSSTSSPEVLGLYACDGCGRCTEACIGKIDIRDVLKRAVDDAQSVPADSG